MTNRIGTYFSMSILSRRKIAALCTIAFVCASAANAQTPTATNPQAPSTAEVERYRAMGLYKGMTTLPSWAMPPPEIRRTSTVPSNFPIEVYRSNVLSTTFVHSTKGAASASLTICTRDQPDVVFQFYQAALRRGGWTTQVPNADALAKMGVQDRFYTIMGTKDVQGVNLTITTNKVNSTTVVAINWYVVRNSQ